MAEASKLALAPSKGCTVVEVRTECSGGAEEEHPDSLKEGNTLGRPKETFLKTECHRN